MSDILFPYTWADLDVKFIERECEVIMELPFIVKVYSPPYCGSAPLLLSWIPWLLHIFNDAKIRFSRKKCWYLFEDINYFGVDFPGFPVDFTI